MILNTKVFLLPMLMTMAFMLASCCHYPQQRASVATFHPTGSPSPEIRTSQVEVSGPETYMRIKLGLDGLCKDIAFGIVDRKGEPIEPPKPGLCSDGLDLNDIRFCIPMSQSHEQNAEIEGAEVPMYCAQVTFLSEGTDIRLKPDEQPASSNTICKYSGGHLQCYPR